MCVSSLSICQDKNDKVYWRQILLYNIQDILLWLNDVKLTSYISSIEVKP